MKIQSAGRLGNILFIWFYALTVSERAHSKKIEVFVDKFHTNIGHDLLETLNLLETPKVKLKVSNSLGLLLSGIDKISSRYPNLGRVIRRKLRIETEAFDGLTDRAWIQRGFFQQRYVSQETSDVALNHLDEVLTVIRSNSSLKQKFPLLQEDYQAIHVRLTDFVGTEFGVMDINSQLPLLRDDLKTVICTDGDLNDLRSRVDITNFLVLTPELTSAWETIGVLSNAKNLIATNSTLSWWSGFIAVNKGATVWFPDKWKKDGTKGIPLPIGETNQYKAEYE